MVRALRRALAFSVHDRSGGLQAETGDPLTGNRSQLESFVILPADIDVTPDWPALRALRQRWAVLLKRFLAVDPLCHLQSKGRDPRALPEHAAAPAGRAPP